MIVLSFFFFQVLTCNLVMLWLPSHSMQCSTVAIAAKQSCHTLYSGLQETSQVYNEHSGGGELKDLYKDLVSM